MAEHNRVTEAKLNKKASKPKPVGATQQPAERTAEGGLYEEALDATALAAQSQAALLKRVQPAQGQTLVARMNRLQGHRHVQRVVDTYHSNRSPRPQAKLVVGEADDQYEQEADQVANRIMQMSAAPPPADTPSATGLSGLRRRLRTADPSDDGGEAPVSSGVEDRINGMKAGGGRPLPESERNFFEPRMGVDLSEVKIHTDDNASATSDALRARAYTVGNDIAFASGEYQPGTTAGRRLLGHELTHVVQQGGTAPVKRMPRLDGRVQRTKVEKTRISQPTSPVALSQEQQLALEDRESKAAEKETPPKQASFTKMMGHGFEQEEAPAGGASALGPANVKDTSSKLGPLPPAPGSPTGEASKAGVPDQPPPTSEDQAVQPPAKGQATVQSPGQEQAAAPAGQEQAEKAPDTASEAQAGAKSQAPEPPQGTTEQPSEDKAAPGDAAPEQAADKSEPEAAEEQAAATPEGEQAQAALAQAESEMQATEEQEKAATKGEAEEMQAETEQVQSEADAAQSEAQAAQSKLNNVQASSPAGGASGQVRFAPLPSTPGPGSIEHALKSLGADVSPLQAHRQQEQEEASQRLQAFLAQISARVDGIADLGQQAQARIEPQAQEIQATIQATVQENSAIIATTLEQARTQVATEAAQARDEIRAQYDSTVGALEAKTEQARGEIESAHDSKLAALDALEAAKGQEIEGKFQAGQAKVRQAADSAAAKATATGNQYKGKYQGESYPEPSLLEGSDYYERKRKAKVEAADKVAKGYADEFKKKGEETAGQLSGGSGDVVNELHAKMESARQAVKDERTSALTALDQSLQQSLATAQDTLDSQLAAVSDSEASTMTMLDELESSLLVQVEQAGEEQSVAVENTAQQSIAGIQQAVAQSTADLHATVQQIAAQAGAVPAPSPEQLAPFLAQASAQFDGLYAETEAGLHVQIETAAQNLDTQGQQSVETIQGFGEEATLQSTPIVENFSTSLGELVEAALTSLTDLEASHTESTDHQVTQSLDNFNAALTQAQQDADNILNCLQGGLDQFVGDFSQGMQPTLQEIPGKIESEAQKAADKVQPAWKRVVAFVLTVIITVVVAVAITALVASGVGLGLGLLLAAGIGALGGVAKGMIKNWSEGEAITKDFWKNAALGALDGMLQFVGGRFVKGLELPKTGFKQVAIKQAVNTTTGLVNDVSALAVNGQLTWKTGGQVILKNLVGGVVGLGTGGITDRMGLPEKGLKKALVETGMGSVGDTVSGMTETFVIKGEEFTFAKAFQVVGENVAKNIISGGIKYGFERVDFENKLAQKFDELAGTAPGPEADVRSGADILDEDEGNKTPTKLGGDEEGAIPAGKSAADLDADSTANKLKGSQVAEQRGYPDAPEGYHWAKNGDDVILKRNPGKANDPNYPPLEIDPDSKSFVNKDVSGTKYESSKNARELRKNLGLQKGDPDEAHHIVPSGHSRATPARKILKKFGFDVNDPKNGLALNPGKHSHLHTNEYIDTVNEILGGARSSLDVEAGLNKISDLIKSGHFD
jgi:hypothetical protein